MNGSSNNKSISRRPSNAAPPSSSSIPLISSPLSDPGLPSLSSSPQSFFIERTQSLDALYYQQQQQQSDSDRDLMGKSPSAFSEIEVILDDGTTQKRTVSLSTLPDTHEEEESSNNTYHRESAR